MNEDYLIGIIGNSRSITKWLHETSRVSHDVLFFHSNNVETSKDPNYVDPVCFFS